MIQLLSQIRGVPYAGYAWNDERVREVLLGLSQPDVGLTEGMLNVRGAETKRGCN
jgi:hypothetical protein